MSKRYCIAIMLGGIIAYFLLVAFCLGESSHYGIADDPTVKRKGKDGECMDYALALSSRRAAKGIHGHGKPLAAAATVGASKVKGGGQ